MTDEDSKRIRRRMTEIKGVTQFAIDVVHKHHEDVWLCAAIMTSLSFEGTAAEGKSLKEALMNLADKLTV